MMKLQFYVKLFTWSLIILALATLGCQKDTEALMAEDDLSAIPEEISSHFSATEIAAFEQSLERKQRENLRNYTDKKWKPIFIRGSELLYVSPLVSPCDEPPVVCEPPFTDCPPPVWTGFLITSEGEAIVQRIGPATGGVSFVSCMASDELFQKAVHMEKNGSYLYSYDDDVQLVSEDIVDGMPVVTWEVDFTEGTGKFLGTKAELVYKVYPRSEPNPFTGEPGYSEYYAIGMLYR